MSARAAKKAKREIKEHPILFEVRKKLESIREGQLSELEALNARINEVKKVTDSCAEFESESAIEGPVHP